MGLPAELAAVREHYRHLFDPVVAGPAGRFARGDYPDTPPYAGAHRLA
jgi:isocitrate dehydrogenase kinase/phosphatase